MASLEMAKVIAENIGLKVDKDLNLYKDNKKVGQIYKIDGTNQYGLSAEFNEKDKLNNSQDINLEKLIEIGDKIKLGEDCNAPGKLAIVEEIKSWGVVCYIEHPTDKDKKAYFRMKYGSFELVSNSKTLN